MSALSPSDVAAWLVVFTLILALTALIARGVIFLSRWSNLMLDAVRVNVEAGAAAVQARTEAELRLFAELASTFTNAMAELAKATALHVAPMMVDGDYAPDPATPATPRLPQTMDLAAIAATLMAPTGLADDQEYVDWTDELLPTTPDSRARFIQPGTNPLDYIKAADHG
jgi:hypothetical protein